MTFADQLKALRKARGLSQQALADAVFVSRSAVAKWESGLGLPGGDCYQALLAYFGVDAQSLTIDDTQRKALNKRQRSRSLLRIGGSVLSMSGVVMLAWGQIVQHCSPQPGFPDQMHTPSDSTAAQWKWLTQLAAQLREWMRITRFDTKDIMLLGLVLVLSAAICFFCLGSVKHRT